MYAIIRLGGKQYRVEENSTLLVDKLPGDAGEVLAIEEVLAVGGNDATVFGSPTVSQAQVSATIVGPARGPKIDGYTYKAKKNVRHHYGHRQDLTKVQINSIALGK
ncbi:MAG: 50S ribosomal protein L21 [Capsulimonadaceae bacterium]|nr:50S ribosomal protein L21 [Capsulimonadaceae bacterium]